MIACVAYPWVRDYDVSTFVFYFLLHSCVCCVVPRVSARAHTMSVVQANVTVGLNVGVGVGEGGQNVPLYVPYCP